MRNIHRIWRTSLGLLLMSAGLAMAQAPVFLSCPEVNLLEPACAEAEVVETQTVPPLVPAPAPPLFTLQTMHPSTPPLLVKVFNDPSEANRKAYLEWEQRYLRRILDVEALLKQDRQHRKR